MGAKELFEFSTRLDCLFRMHRKKKTDIAREVGCERATISNYVYGRKCPSVERFMELANSIGASDEEILHCLHAFKKP